MCKKRWQNYKEFLNKQNVFLANALCCGPENRSSGGINEGVPYRKKSHGHGPGISSAQNPPRHQSVHLPSPWYSDNGRCHRLIRVQANTGPGSYPHG